VRDVTGAAHVARFHSTKKLPRPGKTASLKVSYLLTAYEIVTDIAVLGRLRYRSYKKDQHYSTFTRREQKIEIDSPDIARLARGLKGRKRPAAHIAWDAYQFVLDRTSYQTYDHGMFDGAAECLRQGKTDCGGYVSVFVALCRAAGVPARPVAGFWAAQTNAWHVWAKFMLPSGEWIPVDLSVGDQNADNRKRFFGGLDNGRVALCKSFDISLEGLVDGPKLDFLQVGGWWWHGSRIRQPPSASFTASGRPA